MTSSCLARFRGNKSSAIIKQRATRTDVLFGHDPCMNSENDGFGHREFSKCLQLNANPFPSLARLRTPCVFTSWLKQVRIVIDEVVGAPERPFGNECIEYTLDSPRNPVVVPRNRSMD